MVHVRWHPAALVTQRRWTGPVLDVGYRLGDRMSGDEEMRLGLRDGRLRGSLGNVSCGGFRESGL